MSETHIPINRQMLVRFVQVVKDFLHSESGPRARWLAGSLLILMFSVNGLNVLNSYVGRDFMTAAAQRDESSFMIKAVLYILVFAASTVATVLHRFSEDNLGLVFREWLTRHSTQLYLEQRTFYRIRSDGTIRNPDERITEDIRTYTVTTLSIILMILNATITVVAFSGVLLSISPTLFFISIAYAVIGSLGAILLGKPLVNLNSHQFDKEADLRVSLIHVKENAELIALTRGEKRLLGELMNRIGALVENMRQIFIVSRNLNYFSTGYFNLLQVIPVLIVAPLFFKGEVEFGVITQSAMAFSTLVGAFSLVVSQFQPISSFTAVLARLNELWDSMERAKQPEPSKVVVEEQNGVIVYENLTLTSAESGRELVKELNLTIPQGKRVLITGPNEAARLSLFRITAGIGGQGSGKIIRPGLENIRFLAQRAYLYPGTLKELLLRTREDHGISEEKMVQTLRELGLSDVLKRAGNLDAKLEWDSVLSLSEEQLLAFTRLLLAKPQFAFLDRMDTALSDDQAEQILLKLSLEKITYITLADSKKQPQLYDVILEIAKDGTWKVTWNE